MRMPCKELVVSLTRQVTVDELSMAGNEIPQILNETYFGTLVDTLRRGKKFHCCDFPPHICALLYIS